MAGRCVAAMRQVFCGERNGVTFALFGCASASFIYRAFQKEWFNFKYLITKILFPKVCDPSYMHASKRPKRNLCTKFSLETICFLLDFKVHALIHIPIRINLHGWMFCSVWYTLIIKCPQFSICIMHPSVSLLIPSISSPLPYAECSATRSWFIASRALTNPRRYDSVSVRTCF